MLKKTKFKVLLVVIILLLIIAALASYFVIIRTGPKPRAVWSYNSPDPFGIGNLDLGLGANYDTYGSVVKNVGSTVSELNAGDLTPVFLFLCQGAPDKCANPEMTYIEPFYCKTRSGELITPLDDNPEDSNCQGILAEYYYMGFTVEVLMATSNVSGVINLLGKDMSFIGQPPACGVMACGGSARWVYYSVAYHTKGCSAKLVVQQPWQPYPGINFPRGVYSSTTSIG